MKKQVKSKKKSNTKDNYRVCPNCGAYLKYRKDFDNGGLDFIYYGFLCYKCNTGGQVFRYNSDWSTNKKG